MFNLEGGGAERKEGYVRRYSIRHKPEQQQANNFGQTLPSLSMHTEEGWGKSGWNPKKILVARHLESGKKKKFPLNVSPTGGRDMFRVSYVSCTPRSQTYKVTNPFHPPTPSSQEILVPCFPFFIGKRNRGGGRADGEGKERTG